MNPVSLVAMAKEAFAAWVDDYAPSMGAALAYYTLFSFAPLLLIAVSIAGLVFGPDAARGEIFAQLRDMIGDDGAAAAQSLLQSVNRPAQGLVGTIFGLGTLVIGAASVFGELQNSLDRIWRAPPRGSGSGLWTLVRVRLLSFGMILGIGFLLIVSLVASAAIAAFGKRYANAFGGWALLAEALNFAISLVVITVLFAMIYKILPRVRIGWRDVWTGAAVTALLFVIGKSMIGLYLGHSGVASGFGAAGSLIVLIVWTYYSAQVFLLGAEFTHVYAHVRGSRRDAADADESAGEDRRAAIERSRAALAAELRRKR
ncbi:MAG TPA: YihY/virulence factor BrkB family protein [Caldimonas sp.]|jgi:membrane protein|nr:YihY/virulence factor BrkB family protein [Caldimonas sp.]HEX4234361.1 YihY/virulence factor BrkB family protein [Caldimonas sp.]